jgi:histidinol dehydrogenase
LARPSSRADEALRAKVATIFDEVRAEGAPAVARWATKLDGRAPRRVELDASTVAGARSGLAREDLAALDLAADNIRNYHQATKPAATRTEALPGLVCRQIWRPIKTCGLYIPGGSAPLLSTLLMLALPAQAANVPQIAFATPPGRDGELHPGIAAAAALCGLTEAWLIGGAQAIAAMTYGAGLPKVEKLFGPGNAYVAEAKRLASSLPGGPQIDTPAGPSELMVVADDTARPDFVAADLLSQAEHDGEAQTVLVTPSMQLAEAVRRELAAQGAGLPRASIVEQALANGRIVLVDDLATALEIVNAYAPEHLSLQIAEAEHFAGAVENAGAVFVGPWSAETFGDYVCGPSHVLPTDGAARAWSGVSAASFMKCLNLQTLSRGRARSLIDAAARLARLEGLEAHARAAEIRSAS